MSGSSGSSPPSVTPGSAPDAAVARADLARSGLLAWLGSLAEGSLTESSFAEGEGSATPRTSSSQTSSIDGSETLAELRGLAKLAREGHSPSARALVNASDLVTTVALTAPARAPSSELRARVLAGASKTDAAKPGPPQSARGDVPLPLAAPQEVLAAFHAAMPEDVERLRLVDEIGAAGGVGHEAIDGALAALLERVAPFMDFEVVVVSVVRGEDTFHRVHRGFPPELGQVDIVPRAVSYCTHCVSADAPLLVHDGASEAFFRQGVMVQKMGARAYLGVPVRVGAKRTPIGALCCIGSRPRTIVPTEVAFMAVFAEEVEAILTQDRARLAEIYTPGSLSAPSAGGGEARPVYREAWFHRILERELDRFRAHAGTDDRRDASVVVVRTPEVTDEAWEALESSPFAGVRGVGPRVVGELRDGRHAVLLAGGIPTGAKDLARGVEPSTDDALVGAVRRAAPGALVARADASFTAASAWIAGAT